MFFVYVWLIFAAVFFGFSYIAGGSLRIEGGFLMIVYRFVLDFCVFFPGPAACSAVRPLAKPSPEIQPLRFVLLLVDLGVFSTPLLVTRIVMGPCIRPFESQ